jgi:DNA repair exonuclease SbcCD ATPase subunit
VVTEINLHENQKTVIVGKNGHGKSLMMDAISFALFDRAFRSISKTQLVNTINKKNTIVELDFEAYGNDYRVIRGIKPNKFEIYKNGELIPLRDDMKSYQKDFEDDILRMTFKTFSQFIVIGSATFDPFMNLVAADRRKIVEDLLDCQVFSTMSILCKGRLDQTNEEVSKSKSALFTLEQSISSLEDIIKMNSTSNSDEIASINSKIESISFEIANSTKLIETEREDLEALKKELDAIPATLNEARSKRQEINDSIVRCNHTILTDNKEINFFNSNTKCPTCTQEINEEWKAVIVDKKKDNVSTIEAKKYKENTKLSTIDEIISKMETLISKISSTERNISNIETFIANKENSILTLNNSIENLQNKKSTDQALEKLADLKSQYETKTTFYDDLVVTQNTLKEAALLLKDTGIKSVIISKYIPKLNELINSILEKLDFFCSFELDDQFKETIKSRYRDNFSYESFSEGEKMRINLAIIFAFRQIAKLRNSVNSNLLIMDEVFDSSLDADVVNELMHLLTTELATQNQNLFIISHNASTIDKFDKVILVEKQGNFTEYKEI